MPLREMGRHSHSATGVDTVAFSGTTHHTTACSRPWTRWGSGSERREKGRGVSLALALAVPPTGERSRLSESLGLQHPPMEGGVGLGAAPELDHALRSLLHPSLLRVVAHLRPHRYIAVRVACWAVRLQFAVRHLSPRARRTWGKGSRRCPSAGPRGLLRAAVVAGIWTRASGRW